MELKKKRLASNLYLDIPGQVFMKLVNFAGKLRSHLQTENCDFEIQDFNMRLEILSHWNFNFKFNFARTVANSGPRFSRIFETLPHQSATF